MGAEGLSRTNSILCVGYNVYPVGSPSKGDVSTRGETLAKELNLERSAFKNKIRKRKKEEEKNDKKAYFRDEGNNFDPKY